jgi:hypothetical protein
MYFFHPSLIIFAFNPESQKKPSLRRHLVYKFLSSFGRHSYIVVFTKAITGFFISQIQPHNLAISWRSLLVLTSDLSLGMSVSYLQALQINFNFSNVSRMSCILRHLVLFPFDNSSYGRNLTFWTCVSLRKRSCRICFRILWLAENETYKKLFLLPSSRKPKVIELDLTD